MNEPGITLAWLAVQVTLVSVPCLAAHALASRRGPASGAWVAGVSLGLIALLPAAAYFVGPGRGGRDVVQSAAPPVSDAAAPVRASVPARTVGRGVDPIGFRFAWARLGRGAAAPLARCRPWADVLAVLVLCGTGVGLLRLAAGLWAVRDYRKRGRVVLDPGMTALLDEIRGAIGCRARVELREVADLTTPATAGWFRPVVLLPGDWRAWTAAERRAVLAHELAHVVRGDYAAGLLARLAVALNTYHPVVRWIAGRLQLQQELAADALGARFAGGRAAYLVALSRLALKQDGRSPCWPAREFLAGRGTLIRRIAMLRDPNGTGSTERPASGLWRIPTGLTLLAFTLGVATLRGPARADDGGVKPPTPASPAANTPVVPVYVPDGMSGLVVIRPAAVVRRLGLERAAMLANAADFSVAGFADTLKVDTSKPGFRMIRGEDVEWVTFGIGVGRGKTAERDDLHRLTLGGLTVRTVAPFDWLAFLRQWRLEFVEAREGGRVYYKITGPVQPMLGPEPCVYMPDDRTAIFCEQKDLRTLVSRESAPLPPYLRGPDWERVSRGLLGVAIDNHGDSFAKGYDLGRPDDAVVLSLFKGVDHWTFGADDSDSMALHASAACLGGDAGATIGGAVESLLKLARQGIAHPDPAAIASEPNQHLYRLAKALLESVRVERTGRAVDVRAEGFGTLAELATVFAAVADANEARRVSDEDATKPRKR